jgi:hypothetical protein
LGLSLAFLDWRVALVVLGASGERAVPAVMAASEALEAAGVGEVEAALVHLQL